MLAFANEEEVATESSYFKDQCIRSQVSKLKSDYKDFLLTELDSVKETKYARVLQCFEEAKELKTLFELAETKLQERYEQVLKKARGSEEEEFLKKLKRAGQELSGVVEAFFGRVLRVHERYVRVLGDNITLKQKEEKRKQKQNKRKTESRTRGAKNMCLSKSGTSSSPTDVKQPTLLGNITMHPRIPSPAPFHPAPLPCRLWKQL
ncbi:unnamed protein product [Mytilus coruscus]|uniref:Uncharacterized protein n=1 Tax=Mytilus coruscus TaxID=42192 RepID=A0A6J8EED0_MYTCO|nr:unnamed protein product [Mytilus coruscus]